MLTAGAATWFHLKWTAPVSSSSRQTLPQKLKGANSISFPTIVEQGKLLKDFIPAEWHLRDSATADLNGDKLNDWALVIESNKEFVSDSNGKYNGPPFYPKMLLVLFKEEGESYKLSTTATGLFRDYNWGVQGMDPLDTLVAQKGVFHLSFLTGGFTRDHLAYIIKYQDKDWFLAGINRYQYYLHDRGMTRAIATYNFMTGIKRHYYYSYESHKRSEFERVSIPKAKIKLADMGDFYDLPIDIDE